MQFFCMMCIIFRWILQCTSQVIYKTKLSGDLLFHKKNPIICILQNIITGQSTHFLFTFFFKDFKKIRDKYDFHINHYLVDTISA